MKHPLQVYHAHQASASLYHPYKASASHESPYAAHTVTTYTKRTTIPTCTFFFRKRSSLGPPWNVQDAIISGLSYSSIHASAPRARCAMANYGNTGQRYHLREIVGVEAQGNKVIHTLECGHSHVGTWD